jgi:hypothetical protein
MPVASNIVVIIKNNFFEVENNAAILKKMTEFIMFKYQSIIHSKQTIVTVGSVISSAFHILLIY